MSKAKDMLLKELRRLNSLRKKKLYEAERIDSQIEQIKVELIDLQSEESAEETIEPV
jgi:hypothetical protein